LWVHDLVPNFIFSADYNWVGSSYAVSDQDNRFDELAQYYTVDMRLSYEWRWLKAFVGVNNLTDKEYSQYAAIGGSPLEPKFYPAPERNWVAGLQGTF
jgi:iron complex outermembrane receptor protein